MPGFKFKSKNGGLIINELGFREGPYPIDKKNFIIVTAGDSVPFGLAVGNRNTYPYNLEKFLHKNGYSINVVNTGIPSYNMRQSFERIRLEVLPHYELSRIPVITLQVSNDVFLLILYREKWNPDVTYADRRYIKKVSLWQKFAVIHYGTLAIKKIFGTKTHKKRHRRKAWDFSSAGKKRKVFEKYDGTEMLENARAIFRKELSFYRDHSVKVVLMSIDPFYYQLSGVEKNPGLKQWPIFKEWAEAVSELVIQYNHMLIEISREFDNAFFFDTRPLVDARDRDEMYVDFMHYSAKANEIVAKGLYDFLTQQRLLPESEYHQD
jgi:lysophospholipase L1-like esterase